MGRNLGPLNIKDSYEGLVQISGSSRDTLTDGSGSVITSLDVSASYATTASFALNVVPTPTGSFMVTGSVTDATLTFTKGDASTFPLTINNVENAVSASYAVTASYAENFDASTLQQVLDAGNNATGSIVLRNDEASLPAIQVNSPAGSSSTLLRLSRLNDNANNFVVAAGDATNATLSMGNAAGFGQINLNGTGANKIQATTELTIETPSLTVTGDITGSNASFTSASIGFLQTITGSAVIIGDEFVVLNANTPTLRYSGIQVYDSGSVTPTTASFEWDGQQDIWLQVDESGQSSTMLTGVKGTKGTEAFPTLNTIQKGNGDSTLSDSSITDDGTLVTINANVSASGYVSASSFIGDGSQITGIDAGKFNDGAGFESLVGQMLSSGSNNSPQGFLFSSGSSITTTGVGAVTLGGTDHTHGGDGYSTIVGGLTNAITGDFGGGIFGGRDNISAAYFSAIAGGGGNNIDGQYTGILAGQGNTIGNNNHSATVGGQNNTVSHNRSVILGGTNISSTAADTAYVPNLNVSGSLTDSDGNSGSLDQVLTSNGVDKVLWADAGGAGEFIPGTGANSSVSKYQTAAENADEWSFLFSSGSTIAGGSGKDTWNVVLGGYGNNISTTGGYGASIIGGWNNDIIDNFGGTIIGSNGSTQRAYNGFIAGASGCDVDGGNGTFAIGTANSDVLGNRNYAGIIGGSNNDVSATNGVVVGGGSNNLSAGSNNAIIGGEQGNNAATWSVIAGGFGSILASGGQQSFMGGGRLNQIAAGNQTSIIGGESHIVRANKGSIIGGNNNEVATGHNNSVVIGGDSLTTTKTNEVVVPSLDINGSVVQNVQALAIVANVAELDASTGQMFTLTLQNATSTELQLINQVAGQTFSVQVTQNATNDGDMTFDSQFDFEGGTAFVPSSGPGAIDILTFTCFGGGNVQCVSAKNFS